MILVSETVEYLNVYKKDTIDLKGNNFFLNVLIEKHEKNYSILYSLYPRYIAILRYITIASYANIDGITNEILSQ